MREAVVLVLDVAVKSMGCRKWRQKGYRTRGVEEQTRKMTWVEKDEITVCMTECSNAAQDERQGEVEHSDDNRI